MLPLINYDIRNYCDRFKNKKKSHNTINLLKLFLELYLIKDRAQNQDHYPTFLYPLHKYHEIFLAVVQDFNFHMENFH